MVRIIDTDKDLESIREIWELIQLNSTLHAFQSFEWCSSAWRECLCKMPGNRLFVLLCSIGDDHVIMPTYIDNRRKLRFIFDSASDVCDAVYETNKNHHLAFRELSKFIVDCPLIKRVHLQRMDGSSKALNFFGVFLPKAWICKDEAYSWTVIPQGPDFAASQTHMRSKDRADLKNLIRKARRCDLSVLSAQNGDTFPVEQVRDLKNFMCKKGIRRASFLNEDIMALLQRTFDLGLVEIAILTREGDVIGLNFILKNGIERVSWIFLYKEPSSCTLLYLRLFEEEWGGVFNFGLGIYDYKLGTFRPELSATHSLNYCKNLATKIRLTIKTVCDMLIGGWRNS